MDLSRREFMAAGIGLAVAAAGGCQLVPGGASGSEAVRGIDEDGSELWLRYGRNPGAIKLGAITVQGSGSVPQNATTAIIEAELKRFRGAPDPNGVAVSVGPAPAVLGNLVVLTGPEGFLLQTVMDNGRPTIVIAARSDVGALYGTYHLIRLLQTRQPIGALNVLQSPRLQLRMMNHWDNLDGSIERGYAGRSLWNWPDLPGKLNPRLTDYARANASIGINGTVLNNVNASATFLSAEYIAKAAAIADHFRPYGIRVYLSINFSAPVLLDKQPTADPLNPAVAAWWKAKADEIYQRIPDFGGFLVKANSEGQPGPQDFGRTHAQGANMLADALAPHKGNVIWRAFIYDENVDPDRAKRAYMEFTALEGQFKPNVLLQVKNGPIDFQPREPFHPLFGALPKTPVLAELQATQEYLGQAKHLVYLGTMWKEFLDADTFAKGAGSTVGKIIEGKVHDYAVTGMAAVLNTGSDANWCGHDFSQANWYAFGRLAWDHTLTAEAIAEEWVRQTFTNDAAAIRTIVDMMMGSREAFVDYTMPLGLHHLIGGDHYAPMPENGTAPRKDWTAVYYHQASVEGLGFDRTHATGDKAVDQYFPPVRDVLENVNSCPENLLLWFHRLPWDHKLKSGRTLWAELCRHYQSGAVRAAALARTWQTLAGTIDARRHAAVAARLATQSADAAAWRDKILAYFGRYSRLPIPPAG